MRVNAYSTEPSGRCAKAPRDPSSRRRDLPLASVALLRASGFDVAAVAEVARGAADLDVLVMAREQYRARVTFDRGFGELVYRDLAPIAPRITHLRAGASSPEEPAQIVGNLLAAAPIEALGRFTAVTADGVRQRAPR